MFARPSARRTSSATVSGDCSGAEPPRFPSTTTVTSPRPVPRRPKVSASSVSVPRSVSSWSFVSSRATLARRGPRISAASASDAIRRCGASNQTSVSSRCRNPSSARRRSPARDGRNPAKKWGTAGRPETASAAAGADGPGTTSTRKPAAAAASTRRSPGSERDGIPASDTRATVSPRESRSRSSGTRDPSRGAGHEMRGTDARAVEPVSSDSLAVTRVSSRRALGLRKIRAARARGPRDLRSAFHDEERPICRVMPPGRAPLRRTHGRKIDAVSGDGYLGPVNVFSRAALARPSRYRRHR